MSNSKVNAWKIVRLVSTVLLLVFLAFVICAIIRNYNYQGPYPYPALGVDVHNWVEGTMMVLGIFFPIYIVTVPTALVLFIVSCVKIKRSSSHN